MRETLSAIIEALKGQPVVLALTLVSLALVAVMYMQVACPPPTSGAAWGGLKWTSPDQDRRGSDGGFGQGVK